MMNIKRILLLVLFFFSISFLVPRTSKAVDLREVFTSKDSVVVRIGERIEYFFAFKVEKKVEVLEKHAEKRLVAAQGYAEEGNNEKVQNMIQNYQQIKEKQNNLLGKIDDGEVSGVVAERTVEQQKTMEEIKTKIDGEMKQQVIQVQEQVVNQVAKRIVDVNGKEGATEFLNKVVHVWAPGTGPGGEAGVVYAGGGGKLIFAPGTGSGGQSGVVIVGGEMKFAPGTSGGGPSGADIKNVEVKTGGGFAPGTSAGGEAGKNVIDPGQNVIDP
ncbi:MAG: DUF5667 domain-containing protein [bacterium]